MIYIFVSMFLRTNRDGRAHAGKQPHHGIDSGDLSATEREYDHWATRPSHFFIILKCQLEPLRESN